MMLPKIVLRNFFFHRLKGYFSAIFCCCTIKRQLFVKKVPINNAQNSKKKHHYNQHNCSTIALQMKNKAKCAEHSLLLTSMLPIEKQIAKSITRDPNDQSVF
jgi:hypothetical protein